MAPALPVAWLNGRFLPLAEARVSPLDRGFLYGDAVYEVIAVFGGRPSRLAEHLQRLGRSLREVGIANPHDEPGWHAIVHGLVERNGGGDLGIYLQVTRGADTGRDPLFPADVAPTVFGMATPLRQAGTASPGVRAITAPDPRWSRCDIKTTSLLANVLLRQQAAVAGANEVILLRDGFVTEAASSSVIITEGRVVVSRPDGPELLPGTTARLVAELVADAGLDWREELVSEARLRAAGEVWLAASLRGVTPVTQLDTAPVGNGRPGPHWQRIVHLYERRHRG